MKPSPYTVERLLQKQEQEYKLMSMFTRRHYVWLASVMRDADYSVPLATDRQIVRKVAETLADALVEESPGFSRQQFLDNIYRDPTDHSGDESCPLPKTETSSN